LDMYLEMLGRIHGRLHITATQVVGWKESALATVAECDPLFDVAIRGAWEAVLDDLIAKLGIGGSSAR
jgi:hypothetical protein